MCERSSSPCSSDIAFTLGDTANFTQRVSVTRFNNGLNLGEGSLTFRNRVVEWRAPSLTSLRDLPVWAGLLTPQGKCLFDFLVWADGDGLLLDCEAEAANDLYASARTAFRKVTLPLSTG